jgi:hypothetical protein
LRLITLTIFILMGALVAGVGQSHAHEGSVQQDELQAAYQRYCAFFENESWHKVGEVASTLDDEGKDILMQLAVAEVPDLTACAWMLLGAVGDTRVVPVIAEFIADSSNSAEERNMSCQFIKGFATVEALPAMLSALSEPLDHDVNAGLQMCAILALGSIDHDDASERLRELLEDPAYDDWVRWAIIESLGRLRDIASVPRLIEIGRGPTGVGKGAAKYSAINALAKIGTHESIVPILEVLEAMPAGQRRWEYGIPIAHDLEEARDRTNDPAFRAELQELIDAVRAVALEW